MPLTLTTPIDTGAIDDDYSTIKIRSLTIDIVNNRVQYEAVKGYMQDDEFVMGKLSSEMFTIESDDLNSLRDTASNTDETWWDINKRVFYQDLIARGYVGTIT